MLTHSASSSAIEILRTLVAFDTTSRNSNLALLDWVENYLAGRGAQCTRLPAREVGKANLIARIGPEVVGGIALSGHTDVVPVDGQKWDTEPFVLTPRDGMLFGRGSADMKAFLACALAMADQFNDAPLVRPVYYVFSHDEEVGCLGAPAIADYFQTLSTRPALAIVGEPTEMQVVDAHKGIASFKTVVTGYESHSSTPEKGVNAVNIAARLITWLADLNEELRLKQGDALFDPPYSTVHVGVVQGGTARNIIPAHCSFLWEIRPIPSENLDSLLSRFYAFCTRLETDMHRVSNHTGIETRGLSRVRGLSASDDGAAAIAMGLARCNHSHAVSFCTEAGIFQAAGIPTIVCGPGNIAQAHKPNEFIEAAQIDACLHFLERMMETLV